MPHLARHLVRDAARAHQTSQREIESYLAQFLIAESAIEPIRSHVTHFVVQQWPVHRTPREAEQDEVDRDLSEVLGHTFAPLRRDGTGASSAGHHRWTSDLSTKFSTEFSTPNDHEIHSTIHIADRCHDLRPLRRRRSLTSRALARSSASSPKRARTASNAA